MSNTVHDLSQYAPRSGNIINNNGIIVNLVTLLGGGTPVDNRQLDVTQYAPLSGLILGSDGKAYDLATLLQNYASGTPSTLLAEHTTQFSGAGERDRVWFAKHMDAGSYKLRITFSEAVAAGSNASSTVLALKTASVFGETNGTELYVGTALSLLGQTSVDATFTLSEAVDGFFLFAKLLKKGVHIQLFVNGTVTDSALMDTPPVATLQGSASSPGEGWFPVSLAAGTHAYKLEVGGAAEASANAVIVKTAASMSDTEGTQLLSFTGKQCNGGFTVMDTLTLAAPVSYLYMRFAPDTRSTFTATLLIV